MENFSKLTAAEREMFLSVVNPTYNTQHKTQKKRKKAQLPVQFSEDSFYNELVKNHNSNVAERLKKITNKRALIG
ncbi:hypothetical protein [Tenacibaculum soleae]|uniref:hypothetical protein n=1 Tax=Tenacibaculum soleae TaxID=447689 RepID=UPI0022FFEE6F|nr:hypothetical protein [Tenacibaculum soleae]